MGSMSIMGLAEDGRSIYCDGDGCSATAPFPVALRPVLNSNPARNAATARGWLCVLSQDTDCYFCPVCAVQYLNTLGNGMRLSGDLAPKTSGKTDSDALQPIETPGPVTPCRGRP
jgi:hypothetical protein